MPDRAEPVWLGQAEALAIHDRQLAEHGGSPGLRDAGILDSALARRINRWSYGEDDLTVLAAAYAFAITRNHPFVDGNKRTAWVLARSFLELNSCELNFLPSDAIVTMLALAAGDFSEAEMAEWFHRRLVVWS